MLAVAGVLDRNYREPVSRYRMPVKRTQANQRPYVHRAGYHAAVSHYVGGFDGINRFSGTCLNRQIRKNEKIRLENQAQAIDEAKKRNIAKIGGFSVETNRLGAWVRPGIPGRIKKNKLSVKGKNPSAPSGRGIPVFMFSQRTRRIVKDKATAFYRSAGNKKIFCTLTFIKDPGSDAVAVSVLNKFLTVLRKEHSNFQYLWVAEKQEKNNDRIHFHLILNTRISIKRFNAMWVLQQYNSGITHEKYSISEIEQRFHAGTMQEILNPVDVRTIKNIGTLAGYLSKYISKANRGRDGMEKTFGCRVWHCSRGVSALITKQLVSQECIEVCKSYENAVVDKKTGEILKMPEPMKDIDGRGFFYTVWRINQPGRILCFLREMEQINKWIISREFSREQIIEYLQTTITPDYYRQHFLN
jgi:hypothetical protein